MIEFESKGKILDELSEGQISEHLTSVFDEFEPLADRMTRQITTLDENLEFLTDIQKRHLEKYPGSARTIHVHEMLPAILRGDRQTALSIADDRISKGDAGGFGWPGNNFFTAAKQWVLDH